MVQQNYLGKEIKDLKSKNVQSSTTSKLFKLRPFCEYIKTSLALQMFLPLLLFNTLNVNGFCAEVKGPVAKALVNVYVLLFQLPPNV